MRRRLVVAAVLIVALVLGWWGWPRTSDRATGGLTRFGAPIRGLLPLTEAADLGCATELALVQGAIARARADLQGPGRPFGPEHAASAREAAVRAELDALRAADPDLVVDRVDCSEYPCLVFWDGDTGPLAEMGDGGTWRWLSASTLGRSVHYAGADPRSWGVSARLAPGQPVAEHESLSDVPGQAWRLQRRLDAGYEALAAQTGGWIPTPLERARTKLADLERQRQMGDDAFGSAAFFAERLRKRVAHLEAQQALPAPPPPAPSPCGEAIDAANRELAALRDARLGDPVAIPPDLDPALLPAAFEAHIEASLAACPALSERFLTADCAEYPCAVVWEGAPPLDECPRWGEVALDRAVSSHNVTFAGPDCTFVDIHAVTYWPPGWADGGGVGGERVMARLDLLVAEQREALGLRRLTPRELAELSLENLRDQAASADDDQREFWADAARAEEERLALIPADPGCTPRSAAR